jgi:hypothetical protein
LTVPNPARPYPLPAHERCCVFLRPTITSEKVKVGPYIYYDASEDTGSATSKGNTVVGHDVWFSRDVTVMPGVTIGNGAIIATAALVTRDVAPYTVVGGNPAALIKRRYSDADVELLPAGSLVGLAHRDHQRARRHPDGRDPGRHRRHHRSVRPPAPEVGLRAGMGLWA